MLGALFFLTAGTVRYPEAWLFMATLFLPMGFFLRWLWRHDRGLLERRMSGGEERARQKALVGASSVFWLASFLLPGLDRRFGWSSVPLPVVLLADLLVLAGYLVVILTLRENSFAARTIRVQEGQRVVSTGPYSVVRHPMYLGISLMMVLAPLALGSWWALLPALATPMILMLRIMDEEKALAAGLPGYVEYARRVRRRMLPGVW